MARIGGGVALLLVTAVAWVDATTATAQRSATPDEMNAFAQTIANDVPGLGCMQPEYIDGAVSTLDGTWAKATRNAAGIAAGCDLGNGAALLHFDGTVWRYVGYGGRSYNFCNAYNPQPPRAVASELALCVQPPRGVRLGIRGLMGANGEGWGEMHPRVIFNGGDPSGLATGIRWRRWGAATATGLGWTSLFRPQGGYYRQRGRIELQATNIGLCPGGGQRTYRRLYARVPRRPGGRLGRWFLWSDDRDLCAHF